MARTNWKNLPDTSTPVIAENLKADYDDLYDEIFYKAGDIFETDNNYVDGIGGLLTTSRTRLNFSIPTPKSLKKVSKITVNALRIRVRSISGTYLLTNNNSAYADVFTNKTSGGDDLVQLCNSITATKISDNLIRIDLVFDEAIFDMNNVPVSIEYRNLNLSFSNNN